MADKFSAERRASVAAYDSNQELKTAAAAFRDESIKARYSYNFDWFGRPIIQYPQDIVAIQELVWAIQPDLIIETGIAHGGSVIYSASLLAMLEYCDAANNNQTLDPKSPKRQVLAVDIDIREHNRQAIEAHPMFNRVALIEGSSIEQSTIDKVKDFASGFGNILVFLDSNHTHDHVLAELKAYAPLVSPSSYCVVFDTIIEDLPEGFFDDRPWGIGDNAKTAVFEYLKLLEREPCQGHDGAALEFEVDTFMDQKLLLSAAPNGYLKRR